MQPENLGRVYQRQLVNVVAHTLHVRRGRWVVLSVIRVSIFVVLNGSIDDVCLQDRSYAALVHVVCDTAAVVHVAYHVLQRLVGDVHLLVKVHAEVRRGREKVALVPFVPVRVCGDLV